jgi:transposase
VRDWVVRFNARGPAGLIDGKAPGALSLLSANQRQALMRIVEAGPIPRIARGGSLAADRSGPMDMGRVRDFDQQADAEPRAARVRLSQAHRPATSSNPGCRGNSRF